MNERETKSIVKRIVSEIQDSSESFTVIAKLYRSLGEKLNLSHHLRPECVAVVFDKPELPDFAPELYRDRKNSKEKSAEFIQRVYGSWLGKGLTRSHLNQLDSALYVAEKNRAFYHGRTFNIDLPTKAEQIDRDFDKLSEFADPASLQSLDDEIIALRRIHHFLESRAKKDKNT